MFPFQQYQNRSEQFGNQKTRLKVQAFAKFYNYRPNNSLRTEKQKQWDHHTGNRSFFFPPSSTDRTSC
jgi:DNA-binding LacI/PurR family transcriptional regulator